MASEPNIYNSFDKEECVDAVGILQREGVIALDCEGVQLGKDGPLTLLQIGTKDGRVYLFDVMRNERDQDKTFFKDIGLDALLTSPDVIKVIHSCNGDSAALFHQFGIKLENVFDTQVAHLVIEEHKGRKLPQRERLECICKIYAEEAKVYEGKDDVQLELKKKDSSFWAKRPLTTQMIEYASGDVTALLPEVYQNQKRYLVENNLIEKFNERVEEMIGFDIDPMNKERRKNRMTKTKMNVLTIMAGKYRKGVKLTDVVDKDERRSLDETNQQDINDNLPNWIQELKLESFEEFLKSLESDMEDPGKFYPVPSMDFKLNEIIDRGSTAMKKEARRIQKTFVSIVIKDIDRKYMKETPLFHLSQLEWQILKNLRPLYDVDAYPETVLALHWKVIEKELGEDIERFDADPEYELEKVKKLMRFLTDLRVPDYIKARAEEVYKRNESVILQKLPLKYTLETCVGELTKTEKLVLKILRPLYCVDAYSEIVLALHWKVIEKELDGEIEKRDADPEHEVKNVMQMKRFVTDERVPEKIKAKAEELLGNERAIVESISSKYTLESTVDELTETEKVVLDKLDVIHNNYDPVVEFLHWEVTYAILSDEFEEFKAGNLRGIYGIIRKLNFLSRNDRVPDKIKRKAELFRRYATKKNTTRK